MDKVYLQVKDVDEFFQELHGKCQKTDCYSVIETAQKMGVTYEEVKNWVKSNDNWAYILKVCHELCYLHAEEAELEGHLPEKDAIKFISENSIAFQKQE